MKQVVQPISGGDVTVVDVPRPVAGPTEVLVQTARSVISSGTERAVTQLAQSSLIDKARARPDLVRQIARKVRTDGLINTARAVRSRLGGEVALGYSAAGIAIEVGEAVEGIVPGQLVATGGANRATHSEFQAVPGRLCVAVPESIGPADAAFATLGSIALHGIRLAGIEVGSRIAVVGLGIVGQLTVRLAQAAGYEVAAIDVAEFPVDRAAEAGAFASVERGQATTDAVLEWSRGRGVDAVMVTAAGSSSDPVMRSAAIARDRASVVVVGDVGLELSRAPFYGKELTLRFARSYGPGRYERTFEDWGVDYPVGHIRWTEQRNMEAVLDLIASGKLRVSDLVTHTFAVADAPAAYELIETRSEPFLAVQLEYSPAGPVDAPVPTHKARSEGHPGVGLLGAGGFAASILVPALQEAGFTRFRSVSSASGLSARRLANQAGFEQAVSGIDPMLDDPEIEVVVVATPHDSHAALTARALRAGKHVFCEKPLALTIDELDDIESALITSEAHLFVGFNRRWSPAVADVRRHLGDGVGPLVITYRVNAGSVPAGHWYHDRRHGGRLLGEVCHFVDTCDAIVGASASRVDAVGCGQGETLLQEDVAVTLGYSDGSIAAITYASGGHSSTTKERVDILGRGRSALIDDYREVVLDGTPSRGGRIDKGHVAEMTRFLQVIRGEAEPVSASAIASMKTTLLAAAALADGSTAVPAS